jgi:hypothetical protein
VATHQLANPYWLNRLSTPWPPGQTAFDVEQSLKHQSVVLQSPVEHWLSLVQ